MHDSGNIYAHIPPQLAQELDTAIITTGRIRIERIVSQGQTSPATGWYDQADHEWVMVLAGYGIIEFASGKLITLRSGDYINIPARQRHRVIETSPNEQTIWLAVLYRD